MHCLGNVNAGSTIRIRFNTNAVAGESITIGTNGTIAIYKDGSTTERSSSSGVTFVEDHDGHVGTHTITIDLSDNTDAGFYAAGSDYGVKYHTAVVDGKSENAWVGDFQIDKTYQYSDSRKLLGTAYATPNTNGVPKVDQVLWLGVAPLALSSQQVQAVVPITQKVDVETIKTRAVSAGGSIVVGAFVGQDTAAIGINASGHVTRVTLVDTATLTTTATNTTNAPTNGDFTATMKTSLNSATPAVTVSDKTGYKLASDGLDSISTTAPSGLASNFREMLVMCYRSIFKKKTKSATQIKHYDDAGTGAIATQSYTSVGADETVESAT